MMMTRKTLGTFAVVALASLCSAIPLLAHHSVTAEFDSSKVFTVKGTLTKIEWINPHVYMYADVKDDNGTVTSYSFEGGPPGNLRRSGVLKTMFNVGDVVTIDAYIAKDGSKHLGLLHAVHFADGHQIFFGKAEDSEGKN
jgi:ABC-type glycerol-3-phosphate transport system substrate-binding protein